MLGSNFSEVGWPRCGEIDIMEMFGAEGNTSIKGTVHWENEGQNANFTGTSTAPEGNFNNRYHVFSIVWDETVIRWLVNNRQYHAIDITGEELDEFQNPFFFILNLAIGGDKGAGDPSGTTFPQRMVVDYIRVFQTN